jgi:hypothetical protein
MMAWALRRAAFFANIRSAEQSERLAEVLFYSIYLTYSILFILYTKQKCRL